MSRAIDPKGGVTRTTTIPDGSRVRHFDELADSAKEYLVVAADGGSPRTPSTVSDLRKGDVVVFTEYYRVQ